MGESERLEFICFRLSLSFCCISCSFFFLCVEYEMICPLRTALAASQSIDGDISGKLFSSKKDVHSLENRLLKSFYIKREVLNRHLLKGLGVIHALGQS